MKLAEGVSLHVIKAPHLKTNHLTFRMTGKRQLRTIAKRALVAQMLATATKTYPTSKILREHLASLFGASLSSQITVKGDLHIVDIDFSFVNNDYSLGGVDVFSEILKLLRDVLFQPLASLEKYQSDTFEIEQKNLIRYVASDQEDPFYTSYIGLQELYYTDDDMKVSKFGTVELIEKENAFTAFQEFQRMLKEDQIDIFLLGNLDDYQAIRFLSQLPFEGRQADFHSVYKQEKSNLIREKVVKKPINQSILQLGYYFPTLSVNSYCALLVADGLLGGYSHSKLFTTIREKKSLAYSIGSRFDRYSGFYQIYAGIDKGSRFAVLKLITTAMSEMKTGRFSSQQLTQTKKMLISSLKMAYDHPKALIEQCYNGIQFQFLESNLDDLVAKINQVTKSDVMSMTSKLNLQAVYFLEGE